MRKNILEMNELIPSRLLKKAEREQIPDIKQEFHRFRFLYIIFKLSQLFTGNIVLKCFGNKMAEYRNKRIINILNKLSMIWIRVGQALTMRGGLLTQEIGMQLMNLNDKGGKNSYSIIKNVVENELGYPINEAFDHFEEKPFNATSLAQIHLAKLKKEQIWTAVRVSKPGAEKLFDKDLKILLRFVKILNFFSIQTNMRWFELYTELCNIKEKELNYYYEAAALEELEKNLINQPVHVPKLFRKYCSKGLLVMEYLQGALLSDYLYVKKKDPERLELWLKKNNIEPKKIAIQLFNSTYRQVFEDNFFHGDMNTHNIILLKDSNIAIIECRSTGSLERESLEKQKLFLKSLSNGEFVTAAEIYFLLASSLPKVDLNSIKEKFIKVWRLWETRTYIKKLPYLQKSLGYMTGNINKIVHDSQFTPLWSFVKLNCAWIHLDNSISRLYPELNYLKHLRDYFKQAAQREEIDKMRNLPSRITDSMAAMHEIPKRTAEYKLFRETLMRRQGQAVQSSASKLDSVLAAAFGFCSYFILIIIFFMSLVFGMRFISDSIKPFLGDQLYVLSKHIPQMSFSLWILILVFLVFLYRFFRVQRKQFFHSEYGHDNFNNHSNN